MPLDKKDQERLTAELTKYAEEGASDDDLRVFRDSFISELKKKGQSGTGSVSGGAPVSSSGSKTEYVAKPGVTNKGVDLKPLKPEEPEFTPAPPPPPIAEETSFGRDIYESLGRGSSRLGSMLARTPSMIYDIAALPQNIIAKYTGVNIGTSANQFAENVGLPENEIAQYYDNLVQTSQAKIQEKYDKGVSEYFSNGDYEKGFKLLANQVVESAPISISMMLGNAAGLTTAQSILGGGVAFAADKKKELDENPNLDEATKVSAALANGMLEGMFEQYGVTKLGGVVKEVLKKEGKEAAAEIARKGFMETYAPIMKKYIGIGFEESLSEAATQFSQNAVDKYGGVNPEQEFMQGVLDAAIVGLGSAASFSLAPASIETLKGRKNREAASKLFEQKEAIENDIQNVPDAAKNILSQKAGEINEKAADIAIADKEALAALPEEIKAQVEENHGQILAIEKSLLNENLSDQTKKELESKLDELNKEQDKLYESGQPDNIPTEVKGSDIEGKDTSGESGTGKDPAASELGDNPDAVQADEGEPTAVVDSDGSAEPGVQALVDTAKELGRPTNILGGSIYDALTSGEDKQISLAIQTVKDMVADNPVRATEAIGKDIVDAVMAKPIESSAEKGKIAEVDNIIKKGIDKTNGYKNFREVASEKEIEIKLVPLDEIAPFVEVDREVDPKEENQILDLAKSIKENGFLEPVQFMSDGKNGRIAEGNSRIAAAKLLGLKEVPVWFHSVNNAGKNYDGEEMPLTEFTKKDIPLNETKEKQNNSENTETPAGSVERQVPAEEISGNAPVTPLEPTPDKVEEPAEQGSDAGALTPEKVKKTLVTRRAYEGEFREGVKKELEDIGLTRDVDNLVIAQGKAKAVVESVGVDAALDAVKSGDIQGAAAAFVWDEAVNEVNKKLQTETDPEQIAELERQEAELLEEWGNSQWKSGAFNSAMQKILLESDLGYNLQRKIQEYKDRNGGEIPAEVEAKFRELDKQLKEVNRKLAEAEQRAKVAEDEAAIKGIKEATKRKNPSTKKPSLTEAEQTRRNELRGKFSGVLNDITRVATLLADSEFREYVGLVFKEAKGDFTYFAKQLIKEVGKGIKDYVNRLWTESGGVEPEAVGKLKISTDLIRSLVERGIDNIEDLTTAVMEEIGVEPTEANHRLVRDTITDYGKTSNLDQEEIATQIRELKRVGRILSALEDIAQGKRPVKSGLQRDKVDAEERALRKELREALKGLPLDLEAQEEQLKTQTEATKQRLKNQIEDLQREIDKGEKVPKNPNAVKDDEELKALREQRDKLREQHDQIFKDEAFKEAQKLDRAKQSTQRVIDNLQRRIREQDFSKKKIKRPIADNELNKLRAEKLRLREEYDVEFYKNEIKNRTKRQKTIDTLWDLWGVTRLLRATGEMSFVGYQGLKLSIAHPKQAAQAFKNSFKFMASNKKANEWLRLLKTQDYYPALKESKLAITEPNAELTAREELFYSDYVDMMWNFLGTPLKLKSDEAFQKWKDASPFKALERAAVGYLDTLRVLRFLDGQEMLQREGISFDSNPDAYKQMADVVNTLTGRASIGTRTNADTLSKVFFSPRAWASAIKTATPYAFYHFGKMRAGEKSYKPSVAQKMAFLDFVKFMTFTTTMVGLAAAALNDDGDDETGVELDPRSSDFGKIRIGNKRIDPWGGMIQQIIFTSRIIMDSVKNDEGKVLPLGVPYQSSTMAELVIDMATNKLAPTPSLIAKRAMSKVRKGERVDRYGHPLDMSDELLKNLYPIYFETIKELSADGFTPLDGILAFYAFFGGGVQVYDEKK